MNSSGIPTSDRVKIAGMVALLVGILLLDRGFANWRNRSSNFPDQNGVYLPPLPDAPPLTFIQAHRLEKPMEYTGIALIVLSVVLFSLRVTPGAPAEPPSR